MSAAVTPGRFQEDHPDVHAEASTLALHRCDGAAFVRLLTLEDGTAVIQHEDPPRWERHTDTAALTDRLADLLGLPRVRTSDTTAAPTERTSPLVAPADPICDPADRHIRNHPRWEWVCALVGPRRARCTNCGRTRRAQPGERLIGDPILGWSKP